ncbi:MAG: rhodanese-like domain-containing protein [Pirellulaceae bacterium]|nr:rhodanese-like domain-containing protein [Planctomycetales bacterium]
MYEKLIRYSLLMIVTVAVSAGSLLAGDHTKDSLATVQKRMKDEEAILIDVREQKEWDVRHLKDAELVPMSDLQSPQLREKWLKELPKDKIIYCHCKSGGRALHIADMLKELGYDCRALPQKYEELVKSGFAEAEPMPTKKQ